MIDRRVPVNRRSQVRTARRNRLAGCVCFLSGILACVALADETKQAADAKRDEAMAVRRFELLRQRMLAGTARSDEPEFPTKLVETPIFKYSDAARGYVAAGVWKLGEKGRPKALLCAELDRRDRGAPCLAIEYLSLTTTPFTLTSEDMHWSPSGTPFQFKPIPDAPAPEETAQRRLRQFREIARRFGSREEVKKEKYDLRLLPAPVDRYTPSNAERADGAVFFFTFGTNPEVVLLIESDGRKWHYAPARMTGAQEVVVTLDGTVVWQGAPLESIRNSGYTGSSTPIKIPGVAPDGSELPE